jgi:hypothetical protein
MPPNETHDSSPFPLTRWSLVGRAAGAGGDMRVRAAVNELVVRYLPALRAHLVLTRRLSPDDADDLLQNFMASKVLEQNLFSRADEAQGKFRTFLLAALGNYLIDHVRAAQAKKRSVGKDAMQIDEQRSEVIDPGRSSTAPRTSCGSSAKRRGGRTSGACFSRECCSRRWRAQSRRPMTSW